jgi:hypothetical protein
VVVRSSNTTFFHDYYIQLTPHTFPLSFTLPPPPPPRALSQLLSVRLGLTPASTASNFP